MHPTQPCHEVYSPPPLASCAGPGPSRSSAVVIARAPSRTTPAAATPDLARPRSPPAGCARRTASPASRCSRCRCDRAGEAHAVDGGEGRRQDDGAAAKSGQHSQTTALRPSPRPRQRRTPSPLYAGRAEDDEEEEEELLHLGSSEESLSQGSLAPSSVSTVRSRLFASDDEEDLEDLDDELLGGGGGGGGSSWSSAPSSSSPAAFSPGSLFSTCSPRRSSVSIETATSDPLQHSFSPPPTLAFDHVRRREHWLPPPSAPTAETVCDEPDVPDTLLRPSPSTWASDTLQSQYKTPPATPPRSAQANSPTRPESLLTKSLLALSRLPNLTLADMLPRSALAPASRPVDEDLASLPAGWGPAERRRVLAAEPSFAADEARAGFRYLLRRPPLPFSAGRRLAAATAFSSRKGVADSGQAIDEVEAIGYGFGGFGLQDLGASALSAASKESEDVVAATADSPASPTADVPPLPPRPHERHGASGPLFGGPIAPAPSSTTTTEGPQSPSDDPAVASGDSSSSVTATSPAPLPPRFISNHRHLLMLSLEFEMMRHAKIRGPLRQRAVIVRQATSPPRDRGAGRERSRLREEVEPATATAA